VGDPRRPLGLERHPTDSGKVESGLIDGFQHLWIALVDHRQQEVLRDRRPASL
jgi:hypothetical protein